MKFLRKVARYGAVVLAAAMLIVVVAKAQGCERPVPSDEPPEAEPATTPRPDDGIDDEVPDSGAAVDASTDAAAGDAPDHGTDAGAAETEEGGSIVPQPEEEPRRVLPATKSGAIRVMDEPKQKPVPQRQQQNDLNPR